MRIALVVHPGRERALEAGAEIVRLCRERGLETRSIENVDVGADERVASEALAAGADLVVSVGGDGTLLHTAHLAAAADVPVLGFNVGRLGFLTEADPGEAAALLDGFVEGDLEVDQRLTLEAAAEGTEWRDPQWALNEIMVEKRARHRVITLAAHVRGEYLTTFSGDGVIVATPTGSTAYSFSARGPIVEPTVECLVLTPVSPHMVFDRPIVLDASADVTLTVEGEEPGLLAADGRRGMELPIGASVHIRRSPRPARLVRRPQTASFFEKLREKFSLPTGPRGADPGRANDPPGR